PQSVVREIHGDLQMLPDMGDAAADARALALAEQALEYGSENIDDLRREMDAAAAALEFERAAFLRDRIQELEGGGSGRGGRKAGTKVAPNPAKKSASAKNPPAGKRRS